MDGSSNAGFTSDDSRFRRTERAATRRVGDVLLVGDPDGDVGVMRVEGAGILIWEELVQERTFPALMQGIARAVGASVLEIERDATTVLQHLVDANLVLLR